MTESGYSLSDIAAVSGSRNNDGMFGGDWGAWIILFLIFGLFGNGRGFGGFGGGNGGGSCGCAPCATQADVRAAVENFFNVSAQAYIDVPCGCCATIAVENTSDQAIEVQNANLIVVRVA